MFSQTQTPLVRDEIARIKIKALRRGIWFKVLTTIERACLNLTLRVVDRVRSHLLRKALSSIIAKLEEALESRVLLLVREIGYSLASELSRIAQQWGNKSAVNWAKDAGFVQYLTITHMNAPQ